MVLIADETLLDEKLLYLLMGKTFRSDVYAQFPCGKIKKVSPNNGGIYYQANISPDGSKIVFFGNDLGPPRVWCHDLEEDKTFPLTPVGVSGRHPVFSSDGKLIAFSSDIAFHQERERIEYMHGSGTPPRHLNVNLFTMDINERQPQQVTFGKFQDQRPAFSPDGKLLAFVSNRSGRERIWIVPTDGSAEPQPLQDSGYGYRPWFSVDGKTIYFFSDINKRHQICALDINRKTITPLKNDDLGNSHGPFVDASRNVLLMHSNRSGKWKLFELPLNGGPPRSIQPPQVEEALHATRSLNGVLVYDVPRISELRRTASKGLQWTRFIKNSVYVSKL